MSRALKLAVAVAVAFGGLLFGGTAAFAQTPASGAIQVWVTPQNSNTAPAPILLTGVIGDHGKAVNVTSSGKPTKKNLHYKLLELKKGTILVNGTAIDQAGNNANPTINPSNCSAYITATATIPILSGTGEYSGITGSIAMTETFAFLLPTKKNGTCNESNSANPVSQWGTLYGSGTVSFG